MRILKAIIAGCSHIGVSKKIQSIFFKFKGMGGEDGGLSSIKLVIYYFRYDHPPKNRTVS